MKSLTLSHCKLLYCRFSVIYGDKFVKSNHDDNFKTIWYEEWLSGLLGIDISLIKGALDHCKITLEWPPSVAEFRRICESLDGFPTLEKSLSSAVRGDFFHPIIAMAYDKVGSWAMKNCKESELLLKFKIAYQESLTDFRVNPQHAWNQLESLNEKKVLPEPNKKISVNKEIIGWRERLKLYLNSASKNHPMWDKNKISRWSKVFDEQLYNERKKYLIALDEITAATLSHNDMYDRIRYLGQIEADKLIKISKFPAQYEQDNYKDSNREAKRDKVSPRSYNRPTKANYYWDN